MEDFIQEVAASVSDLGFGVEVSVDTLEDTSPKGDIGTALSKICTEIAEAGDVLGLSLPSAPPAGSALPAYGTFARSLGLSFTDVSGAGAGSAAAAGAGASSSGGDVSMSGTGPSPKAAAIHSTALLLFGLATELQGLRMALASRHEAAQASKAQEAEPGIESELYLMCRALAVPPGSDESLQSHPEKALAQLKAKLERVLSRLPRDFFTAAQPLLDVKQATPELMAALAEFNNILRADYTMRREMLLARLDVTIRSFLWSRKAEGREAEIRASIAHRRQALTVAPTAIRPEDAFTAGPELGALHARRVTDASTRGLRSASVKSVRIGKVPDRGGRVTEMSVSARDLMPAWQARKADAPTHFGGGKGGGGGRGGRGGAGGGGSSPRPGTAGGAGGSGSKTYDRDHDAKAVRLLQEASRFEGEAGAALEERVADMAEEDGGDHDGGDGAGAEGGAGGSGGGRHGGRGKRHGGRGRGRGGGSGGPSVTVTVSGPPPQAGEGAGGSSGGGGQTWHSHGAKRGRPGA